MRLKLLFVSVFLCFSLFSNAQNSIYDIYISNKLAGKMTVSKSNYINGNTVIDMNATFMVETIGTNKITMYSTSYFKKSQLTDAESVLERNDKVKEQCNVKLLKKKYQIDRKNENTTFWESTLTNTLTNMYYAEPKGINKVFSERFGELCDINSLGNGIYEVTLPVGGALKYYYNNGKCIKIESSGNLQDITMKLKQK